MGIFLIRAVAAYVNETSSTWLSGTIVEKCVRKCFKSFYGCQCSIYDDNNSGRMISRIVYDVT